MRTVCNPAMGHLQARSTAVSVYSMSSGDGPTTEVDELKKNFRAVQEENFKLQAVITNVTEVNKKWQKYNNDRQMYVQHLLSTIQDQQEQMTKITETKAVPALPQTVPNEDHKILENLKAENTRLKEDVAKLNKQLEQLEQEHQEHVMMLKLQMKAHRDDWEAERSEKQQALEDKTAVELRVKELQKDVRSLKLKLKEERAHKQHSHCAHCCGVHVCEASHCNAGTVNKHCLRDNPKTYRTSVHLPCTSGHLLSRGKTLYFGDDLVIDGDEAGTDDFEKPEMLRSRSCSVDDSPPLSPYEDAQEVGLPKSASDGNNNLPQKAKAGSSESVETMARALGLNIAADENSGHGYRCSVVHISPTSSGSNLTVDDMPADSSASGVTIGFSSGGLASVTSFSQRPIVKSSSLPLSERNNFEDECSVKLTASQLSLDSGWASVIGPPPSKNNAKDIFEEKESLKMLTSRNLTKSEGNVTATNVRKSSVLRYSEEGVATQTREIMICPGCDQVFPPSLHFEMLDHYEQCQHMKDAHKRTSNLAALKLMK